MKALAKDADPLGGDAQYCPEELQAGKAGWGHGSWQASVKMAIETGAKSLFLFHHEPWRSDQELDHILYQARKEFPSTYAAAEGMMLEVNKSGVQVSCRGARLGQRTPLNMPVRVETIHNGGGDAKEARLRDISFYGAYFISPQTYEPEESIDLILPIHSNSGAPAADEEFRLRGYVLRTEIQPGDGQVGVAVHFPSASPDLGAGGTSDPSASS